MSVPGAEFEDTFYSYDVMDQLLPDDTVLAALQMLEFDLTAENDGTIRGTRELPDSRGNAQLQEIEGAIAVRNREITLEWRKFTQGGQEAENLDRVLDGLIFEASIAAFQGYFQLTTA